MVDRRADAVLEASLHCKAPQLLAQVGQEGFYLLASIATCLLCMHSTACASERDQLNTKHCSCLALERTRKLIYVCCNSKQVTEDDLEASLQQLKEKNRQQ
eukprot:1161596-Pelagomonas_calceolata.AAC.15